MLVVLLGLTLAGAVVGVLQPWPLKLLIDNVLNDQPVPESLGTLLRNPSRNSLLVLAVSGGVVLFFINISIEIVSSWVWTVIGRRMTYNLAEDVFARLQQRSVAFHTKAGIGEAMTSIGSDCWLVYKLFARLIFGPIEAILSIPIMLVLMAQLDGFLTFLAIVTAPGIIGASTLFGSRLRAVAEVQRRIGASVQSRVQQMLTGLLVVQAFNQEKQEQSRFCSLAADAIRAQQHGTLLVGLNNLGSGLIVTLGSAGLIWASAYHVMNGRITIGSMLVFVAYLGSLQAQIWKVAVVYPELQGFSVGINRLNHILRTSPEVVDKPGAVPLCNVQGRVRFEQVGFRYAGGPPVLCDVSLSVGAGETIALVGPTGAGKTTLVSLIPRFFDPAQGRVLIDEQDLRDVQLASLRNHISIVLQEPFLFPLTVAENIAYGRPSASCSQIKAAARDANAEEFISRLPQGYDTVLGERGADLSGGERQRLTIARALLKDAPILILDEPTTGVDAGTEELIMDALRRLIRGRTTFIIAHRLSTLQHADRILVLQNGAVVESGSHRELVSRDGLYRRYANLQLIPTAPLP
jgi:ATP-binding cassette subfamily B protein/subfamily B ATP-binding cassette protein MsbA